MAYLWRLPSWEINVLHGGRTGRKQVCPGEPTSRWAVIGLFALYGCDVSFFAVHVEKSRKIWLPFSSPRILKRARQPVWKFFRTLRLHLAFGNDAYTTSKWFAPKCGGANADFLTARFIVFAGLKIIQDGDKLDEIKYETWKTKFVENGNTNNKRRR